MPSEQPPRAASNLRVISFIVILSFVCAVILSTLASALEQAQEDAAVLDRSKQMMIAARIMHPGEYFQIQNDEGEYIPARYTGEGQLIASEEIVYPSREQVLSVYESRLPAFLVDSQGTLTTFKEAGIDEQKYMRDFRKVGYYTQRYKLIYKILPNPEEGEAAKDGDPTGYVIPVNGFGLWDAIYGYIAVETDGKTVIGISWYDQKETPGLGANISEASWQDQFHDKLIYQPSPDGSINYKTSPLGITVVRGKVSEVIGQVPRAKNAVDGMAGATLTGNGVTKAYQDVLSAYRPLFVTLHQEEEEA